MNKIIYTLTSGRFLTKLLTIISCLILMVSCTVSSDPSSESINITSTTRITNDTTTLTTTSISQTTIAQGPTKTPNNISSTIDPLPLTTTTPIQQPTSIPTATSETRIIKASDPRVPYIIPVNNSFTDVEEDYINTIAGLSSSFLDNSRTIISLIGLNEGEFRGSNYDEKFLELNESLKEDVTQAEGLTVPEKFSSIGNLFAESVEQYSTAMDKLPDVLQKNRDAGLLDIKSRLETADITIRSASEEYQKSYGNRVRPLPSSTNVDTNNQPQGLLVRGNAQRTGEYNTNPLIRTPEIAWHYFIGDTGISKGIFYNDIAYVVSSDNKLHALDVKNGNLLWERQGVTGEPIIYQNRLYIASYDGILVLDPISGEIRSPIPDVFMPRNIIIFDDILYSDCGPYTVCAYDINSLSELWEFQVFYDYNISPYFSINNNMLVFIVRQTTGVLGDSIIYAIDRRTGDELWSHIVPSSDEVYPIIRNNRVYVTLGINSFYAFDALTGEEVPEFDRMNNDYGYTSSTVTDHAIYGRDGIVYDASSGAQLQTLPARGNTSLVDDVLYVFENSKLYAIDSTSFEIIWGVQLECEAPNTDVIVGDQQILVQCLDGFIYALKEF